MRKRIVGDVKEQLDCLKFHCSMGSSVVESLQVRIRGKASKGDIVVGVCYRPFVNSGL